MLRMTNPIAVPDRYFYDINEKRLQSADAHMLYAECRQYGETRDFKPWYELMIHKMCLELPKGTCTGDSDGDPYVKRLTWRDIKGFIRAVTAVATVAVKGERVYVDQSEADRRAFICKTCQKNVRVSCAGCAGIVTLANLFLKGRTVKDQGALGACKLCGCWLPAKVWCSKHVLRRTVTKDFEYPENCWNHEC